MADQCDCPIDESDAVAGVPISDLPPQTSACVYLSVDAEGTVTVEVAD